MLHFGYIRCFAAKTDFSNNPTAMSAFTGIHCTLATRGRSPKSQSSTPTTTQLPRVDLLVYAALRLYYSGTPRIHRFQQRIGWTTRNQTTMSAFTGIRRTLATLGGSQRTQILATLQLPRTDLLVYAATWLQ